MWLAGLKEPTNALSLSLAGESLSLSLAGESLSLSPDKNPMWLTGLKAPTI